MPDFAVMAVNIMPPLISERTVVNCGKLRAARRQSWMTPVRTRFVPPPTRKRRCSGASGGNCLCGRDGIGLAPVSWTPIL
jgi:hypothetical protein